MALSPHLDADGIEEIEALLEGLTRQDLSQLRRGLVPPLYSSRVRYKREERGREDWQSARRCVQRGVADCEDLSSYLAASYRLAGVHAVAIVKQVRPGLKHCLTLIPDAGREWQRHVHGLQGTVEDPSKRLGMKGRG